MSNFIVGLTGGIGSGKSTITAMFETLGTVIVDADIIAREVVLPGSLALNKIQNHFGDEYILNNGQLNRALLRKRVFSCEVDKLWLNNLLHPIIRAELVNQTKAAKSPYCILVAPLLVENNLIPLVNTVLVIDVKEETQLNRTCLRDNSSEDQIKAIMASQTSRDQRLSYANNIINNDSDNLELILQQVKELDSQYLNSLKKKLT